MRQFLSNWRKPTIRKQLILGVTSVHAILMITLIFGLVTRQRSFLMDRARERTLHQAEMLAASAVTQFTTNDFAGLGEIVESLSHDPTVRFAMLTDLQGRILGHTDPKRAGEYLRDATSQRQLGKSAGSALLYETKDLIESVAPVQISDSLLGWAWVAGDLREVNQQIAIATRAGILYTLIAVFTGIVFALIVASNITRQLRLLLEGAGRMARDDLDTPIPLTAWNEVGVLTRAFNRAMRKLRSSRTAIEKAHAELEAEVLERRRAQEELQNANRAIQRANDSLRQFAHVTSHDLQEPLRSVAGFSDLLRRKYKDKLDGDAAEWLDFIFTGATRMQNMIRALLEYSRAGTQGGDPARPVDTMAALRTALSNLDTAIRTTEASIQTEELPAVQAHEVAVVQLFQNLIGNAIKYSKERPVIRISAQRDTSFWKFAVADNGIGIDPLDSDRIFQIFKRAHGDAYPGSGIGLAICSRIVERYSGQIWVEPADEAGSTFYFKLPAAQP